MRTRIWAAVACIALLTGWGAATVATADGPSAAAAKVSKKKAKRVVKRYLQHSTWTNVTASSTGISSTTTRITFCGNGTYSYRRDNDSIVAASQTTFDGNWSVKSANPKRSSGKVRYTVANFRSVYFDGSPGPDSPPPSPSILNAFADSEQIAFFDGIQFSRSAAGC